MTCGLKVDTQSPGWQKTITKVLTNIKGVSYTIDVEEGMAYVSGRVNPNTLLKKLAKAGKHADLCWVEAGNQFSHGNTSNYYYEDNRFSDPYHRVDGHNGRLAGYSYSHQYHQPYGYQQRAVPPPSMATYDPYNRYRNRCTLRVDTQSPGWQKSLIKVLGGIEGVSFKIDAQRGIAHVLGKIEPNKLLKILAKAGAHTELCFLDSGSFADTVHSKMVHGDSQRYYDDYAYNQGRRMSYQGEVFHQPSYSYPQHAYLPYHSIQEPYPRQAYGPYYEPPAQYFSQGPPPPEIFNVGEPQCSIM
ncbi:hypothetical protein HS088_TW21G00058 [Tripterygium wilfordii]|uniref:HMA domain-containing protein n=1 Tax=Tripterygium wilfordii TaxID=458696 RepID=A0A7J7C1D9_TRIWF|nr:hypothetical protein HS088_TW21G00058 [Tripterygium wilfordii]